MDNDSLESMAIGFKSTERIACEYREDDRGDTREAVLMAQQGQHKNRFKVGRISEHCLVTPTTVRRWIKRGKLSAIRLPSGHYRITKEDFRDFLERYDIPIKEELFGSESKKKGGKQ